MDDNIVDRIKTLYEEGVLIPENLTIDARQRLLDGLEKILREIKPKSMQSLPELSVLDRDIDYGAIRQTSQELFGNTKTATRLTNEMRGTLKLKTYKDLVDYAKNYYAQKDGDLKEVGGVRQIFYKSNRSGNGPGTFSHIILYSHLNSLGIQIFPNRYSPQELGKI